MSSTPKGLETQRAPISGAYPSSMGAHADWELSPEQRAHFKESGYRSLAPVVASALGVKEVLLPKGSSLETMRMLVVEKNRLFFNRWRPQNETYLHGFRKHEQGRNAKEIFDFDPLVAEKDQQIHQLAKRILK